MYTDTECVRSQHNVFRFLFVLISLKWLSIVFAHLMAFPITVWSIKSNAVLTRLSAVNLAENKLYYEEIPFAYVKFQNNNVQD